MSLKRHVLTFLVWLAALSDASCDLIVLTSGRTIEGTVVETSAESVVLEMAMGKVTIARSTIARIERTHEGNLRRDALKKAAEFEGDLAELKRSLSSLHSLNGRLSVLSVKVQREESQVHQLEDALAELQKQRTQALEALQPYVQYHGRRVPQRIYEQYMAAQSAREVATARLQEREQDLANARRELALSRQSLADSRSEMRAKYQSIRERRDELQSLGCPLEALQGVDKTLDRYASGALSHQIPLRREGNSFFLKVQLNDRLTEEFILDTGCSTLLLTPGVADRLQLPQDAFLGTSSTLIADGSSIEVQNVYLDSVEVSGVRAGRVLAQIALADNGNVPLLLGMSFLERFRFSIDAQRALLTLE